MLRTDSRPLFSNSTLMSRYSRIFFRPKTPSITESSSKLSSADPNNTSSPGLSYPPSSSLPSSSSHRSPPHPYTLAALYSPTGATSRDATLTSNVQHYRDLRNEKPPDNPVLVDSAGFQYPQNSKRTRTAPSEGLDQLPPLQLRPVILFILFIPIPPLLSMLYLLTGHVILGKFHTSPQSIFRSPLLSSVESGATGGAILSIPLALLLYILTPAVPSSAAPPSREDFFEDDNSNLTQTQSLRYTTYIISVLVVVCIGCVSGPLGVTVLSSGSMNMFVGDKKLLSTGASALAGILGGIIVSFGTTIVFVGGLLVWTCIIQQSSSL